MVLISLEDDSCLSEGTPKILDFNFIQVLHR